MLKKGVYKIYYKVLIPSFMRPAKCNKKREFIAVGDNHIN